MVFKRAFDSFCRDLVEKGIDCYVIARVREPS